MQQQLVLGLEGGGTKSEWVLISPVDNKVVRQGVLPAANLKLIGDESLERMLKLVPGDLTHAGIFLAGCVTESDHTRLRAVAAKTWPFAKLTVGSDRESGFAAAFGDGDGIAVISGTGSAVTGRREGNIEKAGGWGQLLGDKGGGYNIAVQGLRIVLSCYDLERRVTPLGEKILHALSLNRLEDLVNWAASADKMSVAKLAPVVFRAAEEGDDEIAGTIRSGARTLADYTAAVAGRLGLIAPNIKLLGGLFLNQGSYVVYFQERLFELLPEARVSTCRESGAMGAAWLAAKEDCLNPPGASTPATAVDADDLAIAGTEQPNPLSSGLENLTVPEIIALFISEEKHVTEALASAAGPLCKAAEMVTEAIKNGGRLFYAGAGTSGRLGVLDASEIPPTFGVPPDLVQGIIAGGPVALYSSMEGAEDQPEQGAISILERGVRATDVVCGITASGRTPFVLGALRKAGEAGARTILITCNPLRSRSNATWDLEIDLPTGPEIVTGSTRLKAGTATKIALNILSTCAMIRLGRVKGNMMVDLRASNSKLKDRATRLVSRLRGLSYEQARTELENANWNVRACLS
jgi:N-acetylmuramic acid 6-phosphate etherase